MRNSGLLEKSRPRHGGLAMVCLAAALALACEVPGGTPVEYRSPRGTYTVQLTGRRSLPKLPLLHHVVLAQIRKGSEPLVRDWDVHFADWFDSGPRTSS